ncbi:MAG: hypothetical protein AB1801_15615 [Chloroflexota bacterium]
MHSLLCGWVCYARSNTRATDATPSSRYFYARATDADPRPLHADTQYHR